MTPIQPTTTLVLDARTLRIIHFTSMEPASLPVIDGNLIVTVATAALAPEMKRENSYEFRFEHGIISRDKPKAKTVPQSLMEANQAALHKQLDVRLRLAWCKPQPWSAAASSAERSSRFAATEIAFKTRISAATEQAAIDTLAQDIAELSVV